MNLDPARQSKAHRNPGKYFQVCLDCGAEVWQELIGDGPNSVRTNEPSQKMFIVPGKDDQQPTD